MTTGRIRIEAADPQGPAALTLLRAAAEEVRALYPDLQQAAATWPTNPPTPARGIYLVAHVDTLAVGMGALRPLDEHSAEVRRLYVVPSHRRLGVARLILAELETHAQRLGYRVLRLETGNRQQAALRLYKACGYRRIATFAPYTSDPTSVCFEKPLAG
ncbi:MAG TPA: GNAT family N-acetyltransferase [Burkholderiaceae bacterium]|nr:GNAT family N-acetyltransferase [Burkholderiaceae bacterium]HQR77682.1 GNAT family N-acetyltransferase [Burkholderiaceae bacterium]